MTREKWSAAMALMLVLGIGLACGLEADGNLSTEGGDGSPSLPKKLDSYEIKGFKFAYYLIPADLSREELIKTAAEIHAGEADTQLILVDDDSKVSDYIAYVKAVSGPGDVNVALPQEWADEHVVANVQKYTSGRWVLCKSYGFEEIADLEPKQE